MMSMLATLVEQDASRPVTFIHAAQNGRVHGMKEQVEAVAGKHQQVSVYWCYQNPTDQDRENLAFHKEGYIDWNFLQTVVPTKDASFYFCGPVPFMKAMNSALGEWGVPEADIHYEFFGPAGSL